MQVRHWVYKAKVDWKNVQGPYTTRVPIAYLRALLEYEAMADPETEERFNRWASGECRDIRFEVDLAIARKMNRDFFLTGWTNPNLDRFFKYATKMEEAGSYRKAMEAYKGLTESIGVHMDLIMDKSGYCQFSMTDALEGMTRCIIKSGMDDAERQYEIKYLAEWALRVIDWFADSYGEALYTICKNKDDIDIWESVMENPPVVEKSYSGPSSVSTDDLYKLLKRRKKNLTQNN